MLLTERNYLCSSDGATILAVTVGKKAVDVDAVKVKTKRENIESNDAA